MSVDETKDDELGSAIGSVKIDWPPALGYGGAIAAAVFRPDWAGAM